MFVLYALIVCAALGWTTPHKMYSQNPGAYDTVAACAADVPQQAKQLAEYIKHEGGGTDFTAQLFCASAADEQKTAPPNPHNGVDPHIPLGPPGTPGRPVGTDI